MREFTPSRRRISTRAVLEPNSGGSDDLIYIGSDSKETSPRCLVMAVRFLTVARIGGLGEQTRQLFGAVPQVFLDDDD
jgi:hypothetical protein